MTGPKRFMVDEATAGRRLDRLLAERPDVASRAIAQRMIASGLVALNGKPVIAKNARVGAGTEVEYELPEAPPSELVPEDVALSVVYEDQDLVVVSKPAGMVTHPVAGRTRGTLVNALLARTSLASAGAPLRPGIVHRLDKGTSGLMVVAKSDRAYYALVDMIKARQVGRVYQALVRGHFPEGEGEADLPIGRSPWDRKRMAVVPGGRPARSRFRVLGRFGGAPVDYSLVEATLDTGRTHQIRVHLAYIGYPIVGDPDYGRSGDNLGLTRPFLHAWKLSFRHPFSGEELSFEEPLPEELAVVVAKFTKVSGGASG